ncbi:hypothetical protein M378DRAFT_159031 [Amanita muscaria Koide BX008]|uniref:Uncharacterized protein n=1 Tax=Amanita muscaria (strain Koide BX008) TaxID=946122 RepID=A0A0C2XEH0_AMAMK|nr:hypothetical protein M378DRAFT_159031 [Amanita muscaria Koide BX008]
MAEPILAFKAGRAFRRQGTNFVDAEPTKGSVELSRGDDELLHFLWKNRTNNHIEEDLILFPSDAIFEKVPQVTSGRVYVLKFSSSNQRHFFWMQDVSSARDDEFVNNVNGLLQDLDYTPVWNTSASASGSSSQPQASTSQAQPSCTTTGTFQASAEQLAALQQILTSMTGPAGTDVPELSLTDILTPANITPLFTSHPELINALYPHLPPDLPVPPSSEAIQQIVSSPQFRSAVANFDQALRTGLLGGLVRNLGLPEEAGTGIEPFLRAIQDQADRERRSSGGGSSGQDIMDTD